MEERQLVLACRLVKMPEVCQSVGSSSQTEDLHLNYLKVSVAEAAGADNHLLSFFECC